MQTNKMKEKVQCVYQSQNSLIPAILGEKKLKTVPTSTQNFEI